MATQVIIGKKYTMHIRNVLDNGKINPIIRFSENETTNKEGKYNLLPEIFEVDEIAEKLLTQNNGIE